MDFKKNVAIKLEKNFKSTEFDCRGRGCCDKTIIDMNLVKKLQKIREHFGRAVVINSGYRCKKHNKSVGGVINSKHMQGIAADIVVKGVKPSEVAKYAEQIGFKGIGVYRTFTHVDLRKKRAKWRG